MKNIIIGLITLILIFNIFAPITLSDDTTQESRRISFNSFVDLEFDISLLDEPLAIDESISIPITVKYWTDIPNFFTNLPSLFSNYILFGSFLPPMQVIHLEVLGH